MLSVLAVFLFILDRTLKFIALNLQSTTFNHKLFFRFNLKHRLIASIPVPSYISGRSLSQV